jgi:hypothetical protein
MPSEEGAANASAQHQLVFKCSETRVPPGPTLLHKPKPYTLLLLCRAYSFCL